MFRGDAHGGRPEGGGIPPCVVAFLHHPEGFSEHSGMLPLVRDLRALQVRYQAAWWTVQQRSFTAGRLLRLLGNRYFGSEWNAILPVVDELRLAGHLPRRGRFVAHFVWAEFARPRMGSLFRARGRGRIVGTFHAGVSRLPEMVRRASDLEVFDAITLMGSCQLPFFLQKGVPRDRLHVILHGVDSRYFTPGPRPVPDSAVLQGLMIGVTQRDHAFLARVVQRLPADVLRLRVATSQVQWRHYEGIAGVERLPALRPEELRAEYRRADLLLMPVSDAVANNAVLEAMACGTPVMINRVGAVDEYVPEDCGIVLPDRDEERWVEELLRWSREREELARLGGRARQRAEELDWTRVAGRYVELFSGLFGSD
ncbi:MAG TPA: glycosyltransferase family 1 protein [Kiritimatiellae bacterium]|nr:glycosyltransferase family 1 protein [Kiritimatiellia bacterium]